jgi:hypothetical protein
VDASGVVVGVGGEAAADALQDGGGHAGGCGVDELFGDLLRDGRGAEEVGDVSVDCGFEGGVGDVVDQSPVECGGGVDLATREDQLFGAGGSDEPGESVGASLVSRY